MEGFFKRWRKPEDFDEWERKNRLNWNEWFHDQAAELEDRGYALYKEYCDWHLDKFGWNAY